MHKFRGFCGEPPVVFLCRECIYINKNMVGVCPRNPRNILKIAQPLHRYSD